MRLNSNVKFIDKNSLPKYIEIPSFIEEKKKKGIVGLAHYADIVRVSLLAKYGGIWIDAASWCTRSIPDEVKSTSFYTRKGNYNPNIPLFAKGQWTSWCLSTNKIGYPLFCFIRDMFYEYCKREHCWIDYLLLDKLISIGIKEIPIVKNDFDAFFFDNEHAYELWPLMPLKYNSSIMKCMNVNIWLYKSSYKRTFLEYIEGKPTFYKMWIDGNLNTF